MDRLIVALQYNDKIGLYEAALAIPHTVVSGRNVENGVARQKALSGSREDGTPTLEYWSEP